MDGRPNVDFTAPSVRERRRVRDPRAAWHRNRKRSLMRRTTTKTTSVLRKGFSKLRDAGREDCFCSEQDHPEFQIQEEGQPRGPESPKRGRFLRGRQIAFLIYDHFRVTGAHDTVLDYADLFSVTLRDDNVQEFDTRWYEVLLSMSKIPSDDILERLYKLRIRESEQLKTVSKIFFKKKKHGEEEKRSETSITKLGRKAREN